MVDEESITESYVIPFSREKIVVAFKHYEQRNVTYRNKLGSMLDKVVTLGLTTRGQQLLWIATIYHDTMHNDPLESANLFEDHHGTDTPDKMIIYDAICSLQSKVPQSETAKQLMKLHKEFS